jgi:hypothetical protein
VQALQLCKQESRAGVTLKCKGFRPLGKRKGQIAFAKGCPGEKTFFRSRLDHYWRYQGGGRVLVKRLTRDDGVRYFVNSAEGTFRCDKCAGAARMQFWRAENILSGKEPKPQNNRGPGRGWTVPREKIAAKNWLGTEKFPGYIHRLCWLCGKLLFAYMSEERKKLRPLRFHQKCILEYQREQGQHSVPEEDRSVGRPYELESLKKHVAWALRKIRGDSYRKIAKDFRVFHSTVIEGIQPLKDLIPPEDYVSPAFREKVRLLKGLFEPS